MSQRQSRFSAAVNRVQMELGEAPKRRQPSQQLGRASAVNFHKAVHMLQMQQEAVQKKTFTRWINAHLAKWRPPTRVDDLFEDIKDGTKFLILLQILSGERLHAENGRNLKRVHFLTNIRTCLEFLESKKIKLVNINPSDVVDGKPSIVLGLVWTCILYFQIEELTSNLALTSELGGSTSSLDSASCEGEDATGGAKKKRRKGARAKWQGAATKALLQWVKKRTNNELPVQVNDFGPSWRDGKAFNSMIHSIDPKLIDLDQVMRATNRENLERAFATAEKHLGIPRLLEPEDLDVEKPDEKSIMTYVAQFVRHVNRAGGDAAEGDERDVTGDAMIDDVAISYDDVMSWMKERSEELDEVHERRRYQPLQDYADNWKLRQQLPAKLEQVRHLRERLDSASSSTVSQPQLEELEELASRVEDAVGSWHRHLDSALPGQLGGVAGWLHRAEHLLREAGDVGEDRDVTDHVAAARIIGAKIAKHEELFKDMEQMVQNFSKGKRTYKFSGKSIKPEHLEELNRRMQEVKATSERRHAEMKLRQAEQLHLAEVEKARVKLEEWRRLPSGPEGISLLLRDHEETMEKEGLVENLKKSSARVRSCAEKLLQVGEMSQEEVARLRQLADHADEQTRRVLDDVTATRERGKEAEKLWTGCERFEVWMEKAEELLGSGESPDQEFLEELEARREDFAELERRAREFARGDDVTASVVDDVTDKMARMGERAGRVFGRSEELRSRHRRARFARLEALARDVREAAVTSRGGMAGREAIKAKIEALEKILDESAGAEAEAEAMMTSSSHADCRDDAGGDVIARRLTEARDLARAEAERCRRLLAPVTSIERDVTELASWLLEAERRLADDVDDDDVSKLDGDVTDRVERRYDQHQEFFSELEQKQDELRAIAAKMNSLHDQLEGSPELDAMEQVVSVTSSRLQHVIAGSRDVTARRKQKRPWGEIAEKLQSGTVEAHFFFSHISPPALLPPSHLCRS